MLPPSLILRGAIAQAFQIFRSKSSWRRDPMSSQPPRRSANIFCCRRCRTEWMSRADCRECTVHSAHCAQCVALRANTAQQSQCSLVHCGAVEYLLDSTLHTEESGYVTAHSWTVRLPGRRRSWRQQTRWKRDQLCLMRLQPFWEGFTVMRFWSRSSKIVEEVEINWKHFLQRRGSASIWDSLISKLPCLGLVSTFGTGVNI